MPDQAEKSRQRRSRQDLNIPATELVRSSFKGQTVFHASRKYWVHDGLARFFYDSSPEAYCYYARPEQLGLPSREEQRNIKMMKERMKTMSQNIIRSSV